MSAEAAYDADWIVIGSGFGGSVAALRLAEKGHSVLVLEAGRRWRDADFDRSGWNLRRMFWMPRLGLTGPLRISVFRDILIGSGAGVGGGSLVYANTLYRAKQAFFRHPQWAGLGDWERLLAPHYATAERMLGVRQVPWDSDGQQLLRAMGQAFGVADTFTRTPCAVFFGAPGERVADPYFGGAGPERTGCTRCGSCTTGCAVGAKNSLVKNYLWFAERAGVRIEAGTEVVDLEPLSGSQGAQGYALHCRSSTGWWRRTRTLRARGVVVAAGALGTNALLAHCRRAGGLPALSACLGRNVRTNSESVLAVTLPDDRLKPAHDVAISASIHVSADTHIELVTYGARGNVMKVLFTLLTGDGNRLTRPLKLLAGMLRHPGQALRTLNPVHWGRRTVLLLVMQSRDNGIEFLARRKWFGGTRLRTRQDAARPNPTFIPEGFDAARWLAAETGGLAQSMVTEALANIPTTAHILGGAVIGADASQGVVDGQGRVHGYDNLLVCDGSILPANPGVNPSLTITALAEHVIAAVPAKSPRERDATDTSAPGG